MIVETVTSLKPEALAKAIAIAVVKGRIVRSVKVQALQRKPASDDLPAWADAGCLASAFLFRVETGAHDKPGAVLVLDNERCAKGAAKLAASNPVAFGRIVEMKPTIADCVEFMHLALRGYTPR